MCDQPAHHERGRNLREKQRSVGNQIQGSYKKSGKESWRKGKAGRFRYLGKRVSSIARREREALDSTSSRPSRRCLCRLAFRSLSLSLYIYVCVLDQIWCVTVRVSSDFSEFDYWIVIFCLFLGNIGLIDEDLNCEFGIYRCFFVIENLNRAI